MSSFNNYRKLIFLMLMFFIFIAGFRDLRSEHIFLKDGTIVSGVIVNDAATSITVRKEDKKLETIQRGNILRILYTNLKMGKIHVQMRDGKGFEAYIVDEDQNTYTMRKVLNSPQELIVNRTDVLFIAERNPSGLKGTADTTEIELSWYPPYNPVKHYLLYHKEKNEKNYRPPIKSSGASYDLEELKSNTTYLLKVTAVDDSDDESSPSNELTVTTKNFPPLRPGKVSLKEGLSKDKKTSVKILEWVPAKDPDGTIKEYRIFKEADEGPVQIGKTGTPSYEVPAGIDADDLFIRAVDDRGDESGNRVVYTESWLHLRLGASTTYPFATLDNLVGFGFGFSAGVYFTGFLFHGLAFGADLGYLYWLSDREHLKAMHMLPLSLWAGWKFRFLDRFALIPAAHLGAVTIYSNYESMGEDGSELLEVRDKVGEEVFFGGSLTLEYILTEQIFLFLKADCTVIFETEELQPYAGVTLGAGMDM